MAGKRKRNNSQLIVFKWGFLIGLKIAQCSMLSRLNVFEGVRSSGPHRIFSDYSDNKARRPKNCALIVRHSTCKADSRSTFGLHVKENL
ncbi:hypothetical protein TNIN_294611 [Trichonephila inaurata madagascariensis]|uniref:Uncharacterized protein n=1 Tax=Trichonephila inaurata madagascariensis TaxID=2747483 RepID=A0A8X6IF38_9ARAC|nr:hypothetical protein TNIN_294611 [Trichonephila inaurata madagascariensis]